MSFFMYELAKNPAAQQKAHDEIVKILGEHDGKLTYDAVADMKYVGQCLDGTYSLNRISFIFLKLFLSLFRSA